MTDGDAGSAKWRHEARAELLAFSRQAWRQEDGFYWLDDTGGPDRDKVLELWINARMTYVFSLAHLAGEDDALRLASHGVRALSTVFHDDVNGGWYDRVEFDGDVPDTTKGCYGHAFVLLAASSAKAAGAEGADELLTEAARVHGQRFWDPDEGRCVEELNEDWSHVDAYRGANSNMHSVEAYLFAADVTGDDIWRRRALAICERIIGIHARAHDWRIPEHYDHDWTPIPNYNEDQPADPFRPFGATPGHAFEWSRLLLQLAASLDDAATVDRARPPRRCSPGPSTTPSATTSRAWPTRPTGTARQSSKSGSTGSSPRRSSLRRRCTRGPASESTPGSRSDGGPRSTSTTSITRPAPGTTSSRRACSCRLGRGGASPMPITRSTP